MKCSNCGAELEETHKFCVQCGVEKKKDDFEDYEKDYLERMKKGEEWREKNTTKGLKEPPLTPFDYVLMGLLRNGISKLQTMYARFPRMSVMKITKRLNEMEKRGLLEGDKKESWWTRQYNPKFTLTDKGKEEIEKHIDEMKEEYDKLVLLYEKKDKKKLREGMDSNRMNFPFMLLMGMTTGMMMGSMLGMNQMNMGDYFADMDYAYDMGYADGSGGAIPAEGGDFTDGGGEGGFMDGGMDVGF